MLGSQRLVDCNTAQELANDLGLLYPETSAKSLINVDDTFSLICNEIQKRGSDRENPITPDQMVQQEVPAQKAQKRALRSELSSHKAKRVMENRKEVSNRSLFDDTERECERQFQMNGRVLIKIKMKTLCS